MVTLLLLLQSSLAEKTESPGVEFAVNVPFHSYFPSPPVCTMVPLSMSTSIPPASQLVFAETESASLTQRYASDAGVRVMPATAGKVIDHKTAQNNIRKAQ